MWTLPPAGILDSAPPATAHNGTGAATIAATLAALGLPVSVPRCTVGPVVTRYEVEPAPGTRVSRIRLAASDLAVALAAPSVRVAPIPGRHAVGVEVPNAHPAVVTLAQALIRAGAPPLVFPIGADVAGAIRTADLAAMPHLLIAGATGSGKSVMVNAILSSLLLRTSPDAMRLLLIDMKRVELAAYHGLPHLLSPIITEPADAKRALGWLVGEMERRYGLLAEAEARNLEAYNREHDRLPYIVVVVDELADLVIRGKGIETPMMRLAQKARATGIHLILATQRPSVNVVTGTIKANFPARIAFAMTSNVDSRTILDSAGAEDLVGRGDMLYQPSTAPHPIRLQGIYVSDREINALAGHWRAQGEPSDVLTFRAETPAQVELGTGARAVLAVARLLFG
jgi:S-DNA-T family DNA segregation ATPase FtsK/SpoIIIE